MTTLTDKLLAIEVPMEADYLTRMDDELWWYINSSGSHFKEDVGFDFRILGTVTPDAIDFGVYGNESITEYFKEECFPYGFTKDNEDCFRSLMHSKGLKYGKYVIIEKT